MDGFEDHVLCEYYEEMLYRLMAIEVISNGLKSMAAAAIDEISINEDEYD